MKKVGLVTIHSKNYGSVLQCYATKKYLNNAGISCETLYHRISGLEKIKYWTRKAFIVCFNSFKYKGFLKFFWEDTKAQHLSVNSLSKRSELLLDDFTKDILKPKGYTIGGLRIASLKGYYEYFLSGADQVWNGARIIDPFMFLCFCEKNKRISLAPSFGVDKISEFNEKEFKRRIGSFYMLSAREISGKKMIEELTTKRCARVADPVLLLSRLEWSTFGNKSRFNLKKDYIFVHFLDKPTEASIKVIDSISKLNDYDVLCFAYPHKEYCGLESYKFIDGSPYDYVFLIENASIVFTDSFHTSQFSIIFDRSFFVFERNYTHRNSQQSRIDTLMKIYSCEDRYINNSCNAMEKINLKSNGTYKDKVLDEHNRIVKYIEMSLRVKQRNL